MIIKMMIRTSRTSIIGVTFISAADLPPAPIEKLINSRLQIGHRYSAASSKLDCAVVRLLRSRRVLHHDLAWRTPAASAGLDAGGRGYRFFKQVVDFLIHADFVVLPRGPVGYHHQDCIDVWNRAFAHHDLVKRSGGHRNHAAKEPHGFAWPD